MCSFFWLGYELSINNKSDNFTIIIHLLLRITAIE